MAVTPKARIEVDSRAVAQILSSREMERELAHRGAAVVRAAGRGMRFAVVKTGDRKRVNVWTATAAAKKAEAEVRALTKALDAARG
jgi:hypothetical protein